MLLSISENISTLARGLFWSRLSNLITIPDWWREDVNYIFEWQKNIWKNFRITPYINYAFCVINNASALLSSKTMVNSPEYCIYTSVMNTYCVSKKGFQFLSFLSFSTPLFLFFPLSFTYHSLQCPPGFLFPFFFSVDGEI